MNIRYVFLFDTQHVVHPFDHACFGADAHLIVVAVQLVVAVNCVACVPFAQCDNSAALVGGQRQVLNGLPVGDAALAVGLVHALIGWHVGEWPAGADGRQVERPRAALGLSELEHVGQFADALIRVHCLFLSFFPGEVIASCLPLQRLYHMFSPGVCVIRSVLLFAACGTFVEGHHAEEVNDLGDGVLVAGFFCPVEAVHGVLVCAVFDERVVCGL